ncbi:MAG: phosphoribosylanthranilate isomerase [Candidatus Dormiibacterota bacterium]
MIVKVCGVRTPEVAEAAVEAGADWIGLMLVPRSPRWVDDHAALAVVRAVRGRADLIGVFVEASRETCDAAASRYRLAAAQVHGALDPGLIAGTSVPVIPVINVATRAGACTIEWPPDVLVMLDGVPAAGGLPGGTGRRVPVEWAASVANHRRVILAGGLGPTDVGEAIAAVRPDGVDASSRLERSPGEKDPELVRAYVLAARAAAARMHGAIS